MDSVAENAPQFVFHVSTLFEEEDSKLDSKIEENESQRMRFISVDRNRCSTEIGGNAEDISKPSNEPLPSLVTNEQTVIDSDLDSGPLPIQMEKCIAESPTDSIDNTTHEGETGVSAQFVPNEHQGDVVCTTELSSTSLETLKIPIVTKEADILDPGVGCRSSILVSDVRNVRVG